MTTQVAPPNRFAADNQAMPLWLRSIHAALPLTSQFIVHGDIRDLHPVPAASGQLGFPDTAEAIWDVLSGSGFDALLLYTPLDGLTVRAQRDGFQPPALLGAELRREGHPAGTSPAGFAGVDQLIRYVQTTPETRCALIVDYVSQIAGREVDPASGLGAAMLASLHNAHQHVRVRFPHPERSQPLRHPVFWLVDRPNDLPHWMLSGDGIRQIPIGMPELPARAQVASCLTPPGSSPDFARRFADATEGLSVKGMIDAASFIHTLGDTNEIDAAVRAYRVGVSENPWRNRELREKLREGRALLEKRVKGQGRAVQRVLDLLVRSAMGLTSAHQARPGTGVRGVLYFSGATGVGKTEMAKAVAELVFGKEEALIRFDMSEFAQEGSDLRLIGSPPGYIGHNAGGELTNAVRRRPFSVVLFDEVDKAHDSILDKFLQILSDGRLTDGSGDTVFFNDTIIIFTSNQGVLNTDGIDTETEAGQDEYDAVIHSAVEDYFTNRLNRPELLGRIGDNIVAFRPITETVGRQLANAFLDNILTRVATSTGHHVGIADDIRQAIVEDAVRDLSKGGRGIGLALETSFVNPLARQLFFAAPGAALTVTGTGTDPDGNPTVTLQP